MSHHTYRQSLARRPHPGALSPRARPTIAAPDSALVVTPRLLISAALLLAVAACNGGGSGLANSNNNTNESDLDAGLPLDAQVDAGPWTFDCPTEPEPGHICFRGQVLNLIDDEPVTVPAGAVIRQMIAAQEGGYPTVLNDQTVVQPDGRFIFRSAPEALFADPSRDSDPPVAPCLGFTPYLQFELELDAVISGYRVPENKYGMDPYVLDQTVAFAFYVVPEEALGAWESTWPFATQSVFFCGFYTELDFSSVHKLLIGVAYNYPDPLDGFYRPAPNLFPYVATDTVDPQACLMGALGDDRLTYSDYTNAGEEIFAGIGVGAAFRELQENEKIHIYAHDNFHAYTGDPGCEPPNFTKIGPPAEDDSGWIVVSHLGFR